METLAQGFDWRLITQAPPAWHVPKFRLPARKADVKHKPHFFWYRQFGHSVSCSSQLLGVGSCLQSISLLPVCGQPGEQALHGTAVRLLHSLFPAHSLLGSSEPGPRLHFSSPLALPPCSPPPVTLFSSLCFQPFPQFTPQGLCMGCSGILVQCSDFSLNAFSPAGPPSLPHLKLAPHPHYLFCLTAVRLFNIHPVRLRVQIVLTISICEVLEM